MTKRYRKTSNGFKYMSVFIHPSEIYMSLNASHKHTRKSRSSGRRLRAYVGYLVRKPPRQRRQEKQTPLCGAPALGPAQAPEPLRGGIPSLVAVTAVVTGVTVTQVVASSCGALPGMTPCLSQPRDLHLSHRRPLLTITTSKVGECYLPRLTSRGNET